MDPPPTPSGHFATKNGQNLGKMAHLSRCRISKLIALGLALQHTTGAGGT